MKHTMPLTLLLICTGTLANAACYADYKAKQDDPLRLQYGVAQISGEDCSVEMAEAELSPKLAADGWTLLNVLGVFDDSGLEERKESAGDNYLRY
ncbi:hypothetical protein QQG91_13570 [Marivivens sp. LCG002]|uniref:hypothetical protein n=1 Tax=Marivivens sp. LCG002 TaxID=3051171 RepID=UPI002556AA50|nr:hypothetical protein [Marivivens sp. LCG002]WIV50675.1 hypothetical protein QQG91_13570 [Marivivens sp. LCG002]